MSIKTLDSVERERSGSALLILLVYHAGPIVPHPLINISYPATGPSHRQTV